jgi:hypothetical protein
MTPSLFRSAISFQHSDHTADSIALVVAYGSHTRYRLLSVVLPTMRTGTGTGTGTGTAQMRTAPIVGGGLTG